MKNKKGFTLIELLAIIVILAVIAVITVPIILNIIDNAEKGSAQDSALGYKDALQKYYATKSVQNPEQELPSGYMEISELPSDFTVSGENPSDGWVKLKNGIVEKYSLKYKDYVVSMDNDKNVISEKKENVDSHVTNDYQEVEYLESTGTQYINTGYLPNNNTKVDIKFMSLDNPSGAIPLFGARTSADKKSFTVFYRTSTIGRIDYGIYSDSNPTIKFNNNTIHTFVKDKEKNYLDGKYINSNNSNDFSCDYPMYINNVNTSESSFSRLFSSRLYYTKIYDDDLSVRNLVPVVRKSDNKPGMLDLANQSKNLFNPYTVIKGRQDNGVVGYENGTSDLYVSNNTIYLTTNTTWRGFTSDFIEVSSRDYHINVTSQSGMSVQCSQYDANKQFIKKTTLNTQLEENCKYIRFTFTFENAGEYQVSNIMLNVGSTTLPYEPYGYKFYTNAGTGEFITGPEI